MSEPSSVPHPDPASGAARTRASQPMARRRGRFSLATRQAGPYAAAWDRQNEQTLQQRGPLWVALGDSLSQGIGASAWDQGWVPQAQRLLAEAGRRYRVLNLSKTGATTADVLLRQVPALSALPEQPSLVTVVVGSNDMLNRTQRRQLWDRYREILRQLPSGSVVTYLPQPVPLAWRVNAAIDATAEATGITPVNIRPAARRFIGYRAKDLFHPNDKGYARLAAVIARAIATKDYPAESGEG